MAQSDLAFTSFTDISFLTFIYQSWLCSFMKSSINSTCNSVLFTEFTITSTFNLVMSPWQRETFTFTSLFTSNFNFCNDSRVLGQVADHGLIMSRLTGWIVLKKQFCTFRSLAKLTLFSLRAQQEIYNHFV